MSFQASEEKITKWVNAIEERYDEATSNVFKQHGIMGRYILSEVTTWFENESDRLLFEKLGGDEYFVTLVEEEYKKVTFVHRLKGSKV